MNRVQRVLVICIVVAVASLGVLAVTLATSDEKASTQPEVITSEPVGAQDAVPADAETEDETVAAPVGEVRRAKVRLKMGVPEGGKPLLVKARTGDEIRFVVTSTGAEDTVLVRGYQLREDVKPTTPARFRFVADQPGEFDALLEASGTHVAHFEVTE